MTVEGTFVFRQLYSRRISDKICRPYTARMGRSLSSGVDSGKEQPFTHAYHQLLDH